MRDAYNVQLARLTPSLLSPCLSDTAAHATADAVSAAASARAHHAGGKERKRNRERDGRRETRDVRDENLTYYNFQLALLTPSLLSPCLSDTAPNATTYAVSAAATAHAGEKERQRERKRKR